MNSFLSPDNFIAESKFKNGLQYKHNFYVHLVSIPSILKGSKYTLKDVSWNAIDISVPGVTLGIGQHMLAGRPRFYAQERADQDLQMTFLEDSSMPARRFFEEWMQIAFNPINKVRLYPEAYQASQLNVNTMTQSGKLAHMDSFLDVFPFQINDLDFSRNSYDIIKTVVTFKYRIHVLDDASTENSEIQHKIVP